MNDLRVIAILRGVGIGLAFIGVLVMAAPVDRVLCFVALLLGRELADLSGPRKRRHFRRGRVRSIVPRSYRGMNPTHPDLKELRRMWRKDSDA